MIAIDPPRIDWDTIEFSPRERQVLQLWLDEYGIRRTSLILNLSPSTVRELRHRIRRKVDQHLDRQ